MRIITILFYVFFVGWTIYNFFNGIPKIEYIDLIMRSLWVTNMFFIAYWNYTYYIKIKPKTGEIIGFILGSMVMPCIIVCGLMYQTSLRQMNKRTVKT